MVNEGSVLFWEMKLNMAIGGDSVESVGFWFCPTLMDMGVFYGGGGRGGGGGDVQWRSMKW